MRGRLLIVSVALLLSGLYLVAAGSAVSIAGREGVASVTPNVWEEHAAGHSPLRPSTTQRFGGPRVLPVVAQPEIQERHQRIADEVLRLLPESCRDQLQNFYVRYDSPKERGLGGQRTIIVSGNVPDDEFRALLIHEAFGHLVDLGCMRGTAAAGPSNFRDGDEVIYTDDPSVAFYRISWITEDVQRGFSRPSDFVSGYARRDAYEDFAESVTYYVLQGETFRTRAAENTVLREKLRWLGANLFTERNVATGAHAWDGRTIPWDVTKLPYVWLPETTNLVQFDEESRE